MTDLAAIVSTTGFAVVRDVLTHDECDRAVEYLEAAFAAEADIAAERGWHTDRIRVSYALPAKDHRFVPIFTAPGVVAPAAAVLGPDCVLAAANGLDLPPGSPGQGLHRDHPVPTPGFTAYVHVVVALDDFTTGNGATRIVPGSHRGANAHRDAGELDGSARPVTLEAGDAVCFDAVVAHSAGANRTDKPRRALHAFFARPWLQPHWDFPASFDAASASALDDRERRLLGFESRPRRFDHGERRVVR